MDENSTCVEVTAVPIPHPLGEWRKSSHSSMDENSQCVEVAALTTMPAHTPWRKSSHSSGEQSMCVEAAKLSAVIAVRDSKDPNGPHLTFTPEDWRTLTERIKHGHLGA
ncbi:DUF397 domain-containing protein [Thermomonospora amylolytica]|uniref:DUF397 domain-containing protein n=1 Tax=Thermomonospora amylolytica TaxID=1411117 RepID=UPI0018E57750|nr:DUF397 domain-containing protein [Thermomonospora amylolytica]